MVFTVTGANRITEIKDETPATVETTHYTFSGGKLTFLDDYLSTFGEAEHTFTVTADTGTFTVKITVGA